MIDEIIITIFFYIIVLNIIYSYFDFEYDFENSIAFEIDQIMDSRLIYSFIPKNKCEEGEEALLFGKWKGLKPGCKCLITGINKGKCSREQRKFSFCKDIPSVPSKYFQRINSKKICVKRTKQTYKELLLNNQIIENNEKCKEGFKCCGIVDTLNRRLCMRKDEQCPLTIDDINYGKSNDDGNSQIISVFKITETKPCMYPNEKEWKTPYKLEFPNKQCSPINNKKYDFRYEKLENFTTNKFDLYQNNKIIQYYPTDTFLALEREKVSLWGRNFIGINIEDIKEFSFDNLIFYENISNKLYSVIWSISLISLFFLICSLLVVRKFHLGEILKNRSAGPLLFITMLLILVNFFINLIILIYNLRIQEIVNIEGNDEYTKEIMKVLKKEDKVHFIFNISSLILILISFFYIFFLIKNRQ